MTLHVAALPYCTTQGTQAAVRTMVETLARRGRGVALATYGEGAFEPPPLANLEIHRCPTFPRLGSFRSGPSARKMLVDLELAALVRRHHRRGEYSPTIAHHVEAAAASMIAGARPLVFFAHTALDFELPTYFAARWGRVTSHMGRAFDRTLVRRADHVFAISPALRDHLADLGERCVTYVPIPWVVPPTITDEERSLARRQLGISSRARVLLYSGNLDRYQNWENGIRALSILPADYVLLCATASDPYPIVRAAHRLAIGHRLLVTELGDETHRRRVHASADMAVIPRECPGGLPIKLLDAMARGIACVAHRTAIAGLPLEDVVGLVDRADQLPETIAHTFGRKRELGDSGRRYVKLNHDEDTFLAAFDRGVMSPGNGR